MTPNDIYDKKFEKAVGGYKIEDVNRFLIELGDYVDDLQAECGELEKKLEFLAEKLEEYRADEESLRVAVVSAHKLGESIVREAQVKADAILSEAAGKGEEMLAEAKKTSDFTLGNIRRDMATESYSMESMKAAVVKFRRQILTMYERQIDLIHTIPFNEDEVVEPVRPAHMIQNAPPPDEPEPEQDVPQTPEDTNSEKAVYSEEPDELIYEDHDSSEPDLEVADERPKRRQSNFGPLLFGEDFSLTRHD